jgi:hypothetical protein
MTSIWYEVFPVTLVSQQVALIRYHQEQNLSPWMIPNLPNIHPNEIVVNHLAKIFDDNIDAGQMIVHSTSWRYENEDDHVILTYLAVLPQGLWLDQLLAAQRIYVEPIGALETQYGDHLFPPVQLERRNVLAHALDHLAALSTYDPSIQAILEPEWGEVLRPRLPKSAGCLQRCSYL